MKLLNKLELKQQNLNNIQKCTIFELKNLMNKKINGRGEVAYHRKDRI